MHPRGQDFGGSDGS